MAETQDELKLGIGNEEAVNLKPAKVKILAVEVKEVLSRDGKKKSKKVVCTCLHPAKKEPVVISSVKYENKGKLETSGLWVNKDNQGLIRKGSALAVFMQNIGAKIISKLAEKDIETTTDDKGYLCFKAY